MAIETKDMHAWITAVNKKGDKQVLINDGSPQSNYPFGFEANFSDQPTPATNTVTIYNMSKKHADFYQKGEKIYIAFNWGKEQKNLSEGYITKIDTSQHDGVTDTMIVTFTEGTNQNNVAARRLKNQKGKKAKSTKSVSKTNKKTGKKSTKQVKTRPKNDTVQINKTFRKGTSYKTIIQGIAKQGKIQIAKIQLARNTTAKKAYTARGKPLTLIKDLVKQTGSTMKYVKGKLEITDPKSSKRTWYEIDDQDLVTPPSKNDSDDGSETTWEITTPLLPDVTVDVGIEMKSRYLTGKYVVKSGQHTFDGETPQTQISIAANAANKAKSSNTSKKNKSKSKKKK